jgi:hypothetical protein
MMPMDDDEAGDSSDDGELEDLPSDEEEFEYEEVEIDPEDAELMERMREDRLNENGEGGGRRTLADMIMDKIEAAGGDREVGTGTEDGDGLVHGMNPKIVEVYTK